MLKTIIEIMMILAIGMLLNIAFTFVKQRKTKQWNIKLLLAQFVTSSFILLGCIFML